MVWCFIALYGGPQASRQKFEVNTAQLKKKVRRHLFSTCYWSFRQVILFWTTRHLNKVPLLRLYIVNWSAFCPLGFLTCELYFSSLFHWPWKGPVGRGQSSIHDITMTKTLTVNYCVTRSIQYINFFCREFFFNKMIGISKSGFSSPEIIKDYLKF